MVIISSLSIAAHKCTFQDGFSNSPESYFFHLFYYRSRDCDSSIDWSIFGIENTEALQLPDETLLVARTYQMSLVQLIVNSLLVLSSTVVLGITFFINTF